jgi:hypothetical protein
MMKRVKRLTNRQERSPWRMMMKSSCRKNSKIWEWSSMIRTKYLRRMMKTSKMMERKGKASRTFWIINKPTKDRMMWDFTESKLTKRRCNHTKMRATRKRTKSLNNRKGKSPKKVKKASMNR